MQTARMTILMTPERKAAVEADALRMGVSSGEYIRLAVDNFATAEQMRELEVLAGELASAVPGMAASLDRSIHHLDDINRKLDATLATLGAR